MDSVDGRQDRGSRQYDDRATTKADIGCWVKVQEDGVDEVETFRLAPVTRAAENLIAPDVPMGRALMGSTAGDEVTVDGPVGPIKFAVLDVGRDDGR